MGRLPASSLRRPEHPRLRRQEYYLPRRFDRHRRRLQSRGVRTRRSGIACARRQHPRKAARRGVSWKCVGETGTDVRMLQTRMLPKLRDEVQRVDGAGQRVDAVVVMTGLNDIKECFLFAQPSLHPWFFGRALASLLTEVCEIAGAGCACIVPGHPIEVTPRFNQFWPMSWVVPAIVRMWEDQKRVAAETAQAQEDTTIASSTARCLIEYLQPPPHMVAMMWGKIILRRTVCTRMTMDTRCGRT